MKLIWYILRKNKSMILFAILIGLASGGVNAKLIAVISDSVTRSDAEMTLGSYIGIILTVLVTGVLSQLSLIFLSERINFTLRVNICHEILRIPLRKIEETGLGGLITAFTQDSSSVGNALMIIPSFFINGAITLGCLVYLGMLSPLVMGCLVAFAVLGVITYILPEKKVSAYLWRSREAWEILMRRFHAMNKGIKELQLHHDRKEAFFQKAIVEATLELRQAGSKHNMLRMFLNNWVRTLYFVFIGMLLFAIPTFVTISPQTIGGFILVALYILGPISSLVDTIPTVQRANIAFQKISDLGLDLKEAYTGERPEKTAAFMERVRALPPFQRLELRGIQHTFYREREDSRFTLGPIDLTVQAGELVFIVGGNGSGKTTLAKLLTGLYLPEAGELAVNDQVVDACNLDLYRQYYTAIFSDFFIFEEILGLEGEGLDQKAADLLAMLQIQHKVTISEGKLSTTNLSAGQRKRLALVTAFLEDRPIYLFDEWAADQDPEFKQVFYFELLAEFKKRGKTVFVISHDDRYFHVADKIVKLTDGKLEAVTIEPERPVSEEFAGA